MVVILVPGAFIDMNRQLRSSLKLLLNERNSYERLLIGIVTRTSSFNLVFGVYIAYTPYIAKVWSLDSISQDGLT